MKQLILFRHAKSCWEKPVNDKERDLTEKGIKRANKAAKELTKKIKEPQLWLSSPATRAYKTANIASKHFDSNPKIITNESLYTFSFFDLLQVIKEIDKSVQSVIIFGHNEAFTEFVNRMGNQFTDNLPTAGIACINFNTKSWKKIEEGTTQFILKPKEL